MVTRDLTIKMNPIICLPFNADFDGDQMAIYLPLTEKAKKEAREKLFIPNNLINSNLQIQHLPEQDIVLGIYLLTQNPKDDSEGFQGIYRKTTFKDVEMTKGREFFNRIIDLPYIVNEPVNSKKLQEVLNDTYYYHPQTYTEKVNKIKDLGLKINTSVPQTISLEGLLKSNVKKDLKHKVYQDIDQKLLTENNRDEIDKIKYDNFHREVKFLKDINTPYKIFIESGSRGSMSQLKQLIFAKGYLANSKNEILDLPIKQSTVDGLPESAYFVACYGARKGIADTADKVRISGHLTRRLVYALSNAQVNEHVDDCGSDEYLKWEVTEKNHSTIQYRYYKFNENDKELLYVGDYKETKELIGKTIYLRSPMYCKNKVGFCKTCSGHLHEKLKTKNVGVVAAQVFGERGTQLVLRSFHLSGAANMSKSKKQDDMVSGLDKIIRALLSSENSNEQYSPDELFEVLWESYGKFNIMLLYYETLISQLYFYYKNEELFPWRLDTSKEPIKQNLDKIPSINSWVEGLSFHSSFDNFLLGFHGKDENMNSLSNILLNNFK
jgi:DNA-directed RNA polymerase subunit beta'